MLLSCSTQTSMVQLCELSKLNTQHTLFSLPRNQLFFIYIERALFSLLLVLVVGWIEITKSSNFGLSQPKDTVILQSAVEQLAIINWNVDCVTWIKILPKISFNVFLLLLFILKLIKHYEVRPDPAGTVVKPITRTLLCPATPINLQFLDRRVEPRAAAGVSVWAVLVFTMCYLPFTSHLFIERSHPEDWLECT